MYVMYIYIHTYMYIYYVSNIYNECIYIYTLCIIMYMYYTHCSFGMGYRIRSQMLIIQKGCWGSWWELLRVNSGTKKFETLKWNDLKTFLELWTNIQGWFDIKVSQPVFFSFFHQARLVSGIVLEEGLESKGVEKNAMPTYFCSKEILFQCQNEL